MPNLQQSIRAVINEMGKENVATEISGKKNLDILWCQKVLNLHEKWQREKSLLNVPNQTSDICNTSLHFGKMEMRISEM